MNPVQKAAADVEQLARSLFANGFHAGDALADDMRSEVPLRLMYALRDARVQRGQIDALVLALRDVGEAAPLDTQAPIHPAQRQVLDSIRTEEDLPVVFKALLDGVAPHLVKQRDLVAFYAVMNAVIGKWDTMAAFLHKDPNAA